MYKRTYVRSQTQTRDHECHWPECKSQVAPAKWGCKKHWMMIPTYLRAKIWETFRPGQEIDMRPSREYMKAAHEVQDWIKLNF